MPPQFMRLNRNLDSGRMDSLIHVDLTEQERKIIMKGLRYVRSSIMLETREPTDDNVRGRSVALDEIQMLSQRLDVSDPAQTRV